MQILPKSVKYILAIGMVIGFLAMIPFFTKILGYHCDSQKNIRQISFFDFPTNLEIAMTNPVELFNYSEYTPFFQEENQGGCVFHVNNTRPETFDLISPCAEDSTNCYYILKAPRAWFSGEPKCIECDDYLILYFSDFGSVSEDLTLSGLYCRSNATRKEGIGYDINKDCGYGNCAVLPYFEWNNQSGTARCTNQSICGSQAAFNVRLIDVQLNEAGAKTLYRDVNNVEYDKTMRLKCDNDFTPQITLFGIEIFNAKIWVLLYVVAVLFYFLRNIGVH